MNVSKIEEKILFIFWQEYILYALVGVGGLVKEADTCARTWQRGEGAHFQGDTVIYTQLQ